MKIDYNCNLHKVSSIDLGGMIQLQSEFYSKSRLFKLLRINKLVVFALVDYKVQDMIKKITLSYKKSLKKQNTQIIKSKTVL